MPVVVLGAFLLAPAGVQAITYTGPNHTLSYVPPADASDGLVVEGLTWPSFTITFSWTVTNEDLSQPGFPWKYTYDLDVTNPGGKLMKAVTHIILETSPGLTEDDFAALTGATFEDDEPPALQKVASGNHGMPTDVFGLRLVPPDDETFSMNWSFFSTKDPTPGDFFIKAGGGVPDPNAVYNKGFVSPDINDSLADLDNPAATFHILVPDTTGGTNGNHVIPEPLTAGGLLMAVGALAGYLRRRR